MLAAVLPLLGAMSHETLSCCPPFFRHDLHPPFGALLLHSPAPPASYPPLSPCLLPPCLPRSGGMIFTFYKAQGLSVGASLVEEDKLALAKELMEKAKVGGQIWAQEQVTEWAVAALG